MARWTKDEVKQPTNLMEAAAWHSSIEIVCGYGQRASFDREKLENARDRIEPLLERAKAFIAAWKAIPEADRSPGVNAAVQAASGLTVDDSPPGWHQRGGTGRG